MLKKISNIVFTKNRPLQLEAYLRSLYRFFPKEHIQTYIIYKPQLFETEYQLLFKQYSDLSVIVETDFHRDVFNLLSQISTDYIMFGIDDVVFFDSVSFEVIDGVFEEESSDIFGFSLRFSPEILADGGDKITEVAVKGQKVNKIFWPQGKTPNTRYPFELCATIYSSELIKKIINESMSSNKAAKRVLGPNSLLIRILGKKGLARKILKSFGFFYSPNTLESWVCRWCQNNSSLLPHFIFFQKQCASAIQVNMVNTSTKGIFNGLPDFTVEALNEKYQKGYRLDIDFVTKMRPNTTGCDSRYFRLSHI